MDVRTCFAAALELSLVWLVVGARGQNSYPVDAYDHNNCPIDRMYVEGASSRVCDTYRSIAQESRLFRVMLPGEDIMISPLSCPNNVHRCVINCKIYCIPALPNLHHEVLEESCPQRQERDPLYFMWDEKLKIPLPDFKLHLIPVMGTDVKAKLDLFLTKSSAIKDAIQAVNTDFELRDIRIKASQELSPYRSGSFAAIWIPLQEASEIISVPADQALELFQDYFGKIQLRDEEDSFPLDWRGCGVEAYFIMCVTTFRSGEEDDVEKPVNCVGPDDKIPIIDDTSCSRPDAFVRMRLDPLTPTEIGIMRGQDNQKPNKTDIMNLLSKITATAKVGNIKNTITAEIYLDENVVASFTYDEGLTQDQDYVLDTLVTETQLTTVRGCYKNRVTKVWILLFYGKDFVRIQADVIIKDFGNLSPVSNLVVGDILQISKNCAIVDMCSNMGGQQEHRRLEVCSFIEACSDIKTEVTRVKDGAFSLLDHRNELIGRAKRRALIPFDDDECGEFRPDQGYCLNAEQCRDTLNIMYGDTCPDIFSFDKIPEACKNLNNQLANNDEDTVALFKVAEGKEKLRIHGNRIAQAYMVMRIGRNLEVKNQDGAETTVEDPHLKQRVCRVMKQFRPVDKDILGDRVASSSFCQESNYKRMIKSEKAMHLDAVLKELKHEKRRAAMDETGYGKRMCGGDKKMKDENNGKVDSGRGFTKAEQDKYEEGYNGSMRDKESRLDPEIESLIMRGIDKLRGKCGDERLNDDMETEGFEQNREDEEACQIVEELERKFGHRDVNRTKEDCGQDQMGGEEREPVLYYSINAENELAVSVMDVCSSDQNVYTKVIMKTCQDCGSGPTT